MYFTIEECLLLKTVLCETCRNHKLGLESNQLKNWSAPGSELTQSTFACDTSQAFLLRELLLVRDERGLN